MISIRTTCLLLLFICVCQSSCKDGSNSQEDQAQLEEARQGFVTKLKSRGPAPQEYEESIPPSGVEEVVYQSGDLELKAWISKAPSDAAKSPVVVYLHGGWAFGGGDWTDAAPFVEAGYVVMMPMLRGENGNPGIYEGFYGEVDDVKAAGKFVSEVPYADPKNIFLAGHSVGAMLTVLTSMMPSNYKAAASISGSFDMESWAAEGDSDRIIFDHENPEEVRLRNAMAFPGSLKIPLVLYAERGGMDEMNASFSARVKRAGGDCELVITEGDHWTMVQPAVRHAIGWFRDHMDD